MNTIWSEHVQGIMTLYLRSCHEITEKEKLFWKSISQSEDDLEKFSVCRFPKSESEIPASMEKNGFTNVTTRYAIIDFTPDARKYSTKMAEMPMKYYQF